MDRLGKRAAGKGATEEDKGGQNESEKKAAQGLSVGARASPRSIRLIATLLI